jgi:hypothetical protein
VAPPATGEWNLGNVVKAIQLLVPRGKLCSTAIEDTWKVPPAKKKSDNCSLSRVLELARAKVLTVRQCDEARKHFDVNVKELLVRNAQQFANIAASFRSVHGTVQTQSGVVIGGESGSSSLRSQSQSSVSVEACCGFVVLRPSVSSGSSPIAGSALVVEGIFSRADVALLTALFDLCCQRPLPRKAILVAISLTVDDKLRVQSLPKFVSRPLPGDSWFDGHSYIDINGTRSSLRPDINEIVNEYVVDENRRTEQFNAQLVEF